MSGCRRCGSCCHSDDPAYLLVFRVDLERLGPMADALTHQTEAGRAMRMRDGRCIALGVQASAEAPGVHDAGWAAVDGCHGAVAPARVNECTIHGARPDCCRWLAPDSGFCRQARRRRGLV